MTLFWVFAALGTAVCFAISSVLAYDAARKLGAVVFSFVRMSIVACGAGLALLFLGFDPSIEVSDIGLLVLSGVLGVFLADTLRYSSLSRIGPSLQSLINTTIVPFALLLGFVVLGQIVSGLALLGTVIVFVGLIMAILARSLDGDTRFSGDHSGLVAGIAFGLASALTQAGSVLVAAPVMVDGADPVSATFVRSVAGAASLAGPALFDTAKRQEIRAMDMRIARQVFLSAIIGTGLGMTLQLFALIAGPVGVVSTLSATTPLIILPLVWLLGKSRPSLLSWIGALIAVVGVGLIVNTG